MRGILKTFVWPDGQRAPLSLTESSGVEVRLRGDDSAPAGDSTNGEGPASASRWIELTGYPVRIGEGSSADDAGTILIMRDVTATRDARAVRDAFIGILSHELRTPVTTIYGGSEVLARSGSTLAESVRREVYDDIRAESDRLYRLVENLLVLSRVEREGLAIEREPILLQRLLPRVVSAEAVRWPNSKLELDIKPGLPPAAAEETYVEQVVRNLLTNAGKYGGGTVLIAAEATARGTIRVTVRDDGPGFQNGEEDRLFEIFYRSPTATRRASGAGIGLFVSQQLVRAMGGRIWAANRPEGGAEFGFELPIFGADL
jgi:two-component system sensor histidine kinase KdpD